MQPLRTESEDALIGRILGEKYRIDELVGQGAMGTVYRATQLALKKRVAIKVMRPENPGDGDYAARFKREAKAASRMDHPNSMRVFDVGEDGGLLFIAMEYLEGKDLFGTLKEEFPLSTERIVNILSQILAALAAAHEMGVVHRDLKPENIMLVQSKDDEGNPTETVKVCDFGIAKILDTDEGTLGKHTYTGTLTAHGMLVGTPEYMSPEQARGEPADARSDLYSLGVILFQLMTGRLPFLAESKIGLVIKHVEELPPSPSELDSRVNLRLEAICLTALEKQPEHRFQAAREMRARVREVLEGPPAEGTTARLGPKEPVIAERGRGRVASSPPLPPFRDRPIQRREPDVDASEPINPNEARKAIVEVRKRLLEATQPRLMRPPGMARKSEEGKRLASWLAFAGILLAAVGCLLYLLR